MTAHLCSCFCDYDQVKWSAGGVGQETVQQLVEVAQQPGWRSVSNQHHDRDKSTGGLSSLVLLGVLADAGDYQQDGDEGLPLTVDLVAVQQLGGQPPPRPVGQAGDQLEEGQEQQEHGFYRHRNCQSLYWASRRRQFDEMTCNSGSISFT